jgi:hypothetical protein
MKNTIVLRGGGLELLLGKQLNRALLLLTLVLSATTIRSQTLESALDTTGLTWTAGGSASWYGQTAVTHDRIDAARSGSIGDNGQSWVQTTATGPGTVAFSWKVSSEGDADLLQFYVGSTAMSTISGGVNWQRVAFHLGAGVQVLKWTYSKDGGANSGLDAAFLDEVVFLSDSGPPVLVLQPPPSLTVITGLTATLKAAAAGVQPLAYQWWFNETNLLAAASGSTLTLNNLAIENSGYYHVVVTNASGVVTSAPTILTITTLSPVSSALLLVDGSMQSAYATALTALGIPFQRFGDEGSFAIAVDQANPGSVLAIVDSYTVMQNQGSLVSFVQAGGRGILQYWSLTQGSRLAAAFGSSYVQALSSATSLYDWSAGLLYSGLSSPIGFTDLFYSDGVKLQPGAGATAVAGFTSSATGYQAGILAANNNRTLLNGFLIEEVSSSANAAQLARNEISYLTAPPGPPQITSQPQDMTVVVGGTASFAVAASGKPAPGYFWLFNGTNVVPGATATMLTLSGVGRTQAGSYCAVVTNVYGAVTSAPALLVVKDLVPITSTLLLVDGPLTSPYATALAQLGMPYSWFSDGTSLSAALDANQVAETLVIVDSTWAPQDLDGLVPFVKAGGRVLLQYWTLSSGSPLATVFGASTVQSLGSATSLYDWSTGLLYSGLSSPIGFTDLFVSDGVRLQPGAGATALAGFTAGSTAYYAGILAANQNRTLLNGFLMEEVSSSANAAQMARNEISFLATLPNPPEITAQPRDRTVVTGATAVFTVAASGKPAPAYQWFFNATSRIAGATSAVLSITGVGPSQSGSYLVVVTNLYGAVTSSPALLTVVDSAPVQGTLLFVDGTQESAFEAALSQLGQPYERFNDADSFNAALAAADIPRTLAIVDVTLSYPDLTELASFALAGGRSILEYWFLSSGPLATVFGVTVAQNVTVPPPLYSWGGTEIFAGLPSQISLSDVLVNDGTMLQPLSGATALAGYTPAATANQAAIVLGSNKRTFVNGFMGEDVANADQAVRIAANEIALLCSDPVILVQPKSQMALTGGSAQFSVLALGTAPLAYQWRKDSADLADATNSSLVLSSVQLGAEGQYEVAISNAAGTVISTAALLTQTNRISGAVAWWTGDDNSLDIIGTNHGTLLNGPSFTPGKVGQAFWFDGIDDQFSAPTTGLPVGSSDRTIELWAKIESFNSGGQNLVAGYGQFGLVNAAYELTILTSDKQIYWTQYGQSFGGGGALQVNVWYHIAVTSSSGFTRLYLNGAEVANGSAPFSTTPSKDFYLGFLDNSSRLRGAIDEVTVYDRALSPDEILAIYSAGAAGKPRLSRLLNCSLSSTNTVLLTWEGAPGVKLQRADEPAGTTWEDIPGSDGVSSLILPVTNSQSFFRLTQ